MWLKRALFTQRVLRPTVTLSTTTLRYDLVDLTLWSDLTCSAPPVWPAAPVHLDSGSPSLQERLLVPTALHHGKMSPGWAPGFQSMVGPGPCRKGKKGTPDEEERYPPSLGWCWVWTWCCGWSRVGEAVWVRRDTLPVSLLVSLLSEAWLSPDWPPGWPWTQYDQRSSNLSWKQKKLN